MSTGLVTVPSAFTSGETLDRLHAAVRSRGLQVFITIDHAKAAEAAGLAMRPASLVIFGNPKGGTPLMALAPTMAIDLPLKALVWDDDAGATWVSYNDPAWLMQRHSLPPADAPTVEPMLKAIAHGLADIARDATRAPAA